MNTMATLTGAGGYPQHEQQRTAREALLHPLRTRRDRLARRTHAASILASIHTHAAFDRAHRAI